MGNKRKDATMLRNIDPMHIIVPIATPGRTANEAYLKLNVDLTNVFRYIEKKNETETEFPYTVFHVIVAAILKTITLRPKMNRFIKNDWIYQRNFVSASFVVKKQFTDESEEGLAIVRTVGDDNIESIHEKIKQQVIVTKDVNTVDATSGAMDAINKLPAGLVKFVVRTLRWLEEIGRIPQSLIETDPYQESVILSNVGSIRLEGGYHHLTNWGTTSVFLLMGAYERTPLFREDGTFEMRDTMQLGLTIDERIADGYYYSKTVQLFKKLIEEPELLEAPLKEEVEY